MKKSVGTSLALAVLALTAAGGIALLGGPNVFSVLNNIKFPSKTPAEEKEIDQHGKEIALETKAKETLIEQPIIKKEEVFSKEPEAREASDPKPKIESSKTEEKTQNPNFTPPKIRDTATKKAWLTDGRYTLTFENGEKIEYDKYGIPVWSSRHGRLIETEEERNWLNRRGSSGSEGKAFWCVTPSGSKNVAKATDC